MRGLKLKILKVFFSLPVETIKNYWVSCCIETLKNHMFFQILFWIPKSILNFHHSHRIDKVSWFRTKTQPNRCEWCMSWSPRSRARQCFLKILHTSYRSVNVLNGNERSVLKNFVKTTIVVQNSIKHLVIFCVWFRGRFANSI